MSFVPLSLIRVLDTETTGMGEDAQVCEAGWTDIRLYPKGWEIESGPHSQLCSVTVPIEPEARAAHHITDAELEGMPPFRVVRQQIYDGADFFCAHNAEFDSRFFPDKRTPWLCSMKIAAALWKDAPSFGNQTLRYWRGIEFDDLAKTLPAHRAGPDSWVTAHILVDLLKEVDPRKKQPWPPAALIKASAEPRRWLKMPMGKHRGMLMREVPASYLEWVAFTSEMDETAKWNCRRELDRR